MSSVDERVVEMRFDNKKFESGVSTSINSIEKLKKSMKFEETGKELEKFEKSTNSMNFSGLQNAFNTSVENMSVWAIAKFELIRRAVDGVASSVEKCVKSLSIDQISAGWTKFEEKTTSVASLLAQGYDMSTVEEQLSKLNWYTDETSYNFTDMAKNIAQFTAAGQDLPKSVTALMGIANWAALSGQNAATASRAMYQISQAMSAGTMRLVDYKSIQNANMATKEFQERALAAAEAVGTLEEVSEGVYKVVGGGYKNTITATEGFTQSLTEGAWFTSDVMMRVFNDYSSAVDQIYAYTEEHNVLASEAIEELGGEVSAFGKKAFLAAQEARSWTDVIDATKDAVSTGWMNIFETIFGNYEKQKKIWGALVEEAYVIFGEPLSKLNDILKDWKELNGRANLIEGVVNIFNSLKDILGAVKEGFRNLFPAKTGKDLANFSLRFRNFTEHLKLNKEALAGITKIVTALLTPLKVVIKIVGAALRLIPPILAVCASLLDQLFAFIGGFINVDKILATVSAGFTGVQNVIQKVLSFLRSDTIRAIVPFAALGAILALIATRIVKLLKIVKGLFNFVGSITNIFVTLGNQIAQFGKALRTAVKITAILELALAIYLLAKAIEALGAIDAATALRSGAIILGAMAVLMAIFIAVEKLSKKALKSSAAMKSLGNVAIRLGIAMILLATAIRIIASIEDPEKAQAVALILLELIGTLGAVVILTARFSKNANGANRAIKALSNALLKMTVAILILGIMHPSKAQANAIVLIELIAVLTVAMLLLSRIKKFCEKAPSILKSLSNAMLVMAVAVRIIGTLDPSQAQANAIVLMELIAVLMIVLGVLSKMKSAKKMPGTKRLVLLTASLLLMATSLRLIGNLDFVQAQGNALLLVELLAVLTGAAILLGKLGGTMPKGVVSIAALSVAALLLVAALRIIGNMDFVQAQGNVLLLIELLAILAGAAFLLGKFGAKFVGGAIAISALAAGVFLLSLAIRILGNIDFAQSQQNVLVLVELLAALTGATLLLGNFGKGLAKGAIQIIALSAAVLILSIALGALSWVGQNEAMLLASAGAIAGTLLLMAVAAVIASRATKGSAAMILLAMSALIVGLTLAIVANSITDPAGLLYAAGAISGTLLILSAAAILAKVAGKGTVGMILLAAAALIVATSLAALCYITDPKEMWNAVGAIAACLAILVGLSALFAFLPVLTVGLLPLAALAAILLGVSIAMGIAAIAINLFAIGMLALGSAIERITPLLPLFAVALSFLIGSIGQSLIDGAKSLTEAGFILAYGVGYNIIAGFIRGVVDGLSSVIDIGSLLGNSFFGSVCKVLGIHSPSLEMLWAGIQSVLGFTNGVDEKADSAEAAGASIGNNALSGIRSRLGDFFSTGQAAGGNFLSGIKSVVGDIDIFGMTGATVQTRDELVKELDTAKKAYNATYASWKKGSGNDTATSGMVKESLDHLIEARRALQQFDKDAEATVEKGEESGSILDGLLEGFSDDLDMSGGGGGGGSAAVEDIITSFEAMDNTILDVLNQYTELDDAFSDTDAIRKSEDAVLSFGAALIDASNDGKELSEQMEMSIENMEKSLREFKKSIKDNLVGALTGFEEFDRGAIHSAQELIDNLQDQKQALIEWTTNLETMRKLGYSETVIKKITDMGISAGFGWAEALAQSSDEERTSIESAFASMTTLIDTSTDDITATLASSMSNFGNLYHGVAYDAIDGFLEGFRERYSEVSEVGYQLGLAALSGTREALDSHSPSREFASIGNDSVDGYIIQMSKRLRDVRNATGSLFETSSTVYASMLQKAIDTASATIQDGELEAPTIRLSIDDNDALQALANLRKSLNGNLPVDMSVTGKLAQLALPDDNEAHYPNRKSDESVTNNYTYTQNNYSPKALSAVEIYRHTNRLINAGKER